MGYCYDSQTGRLCCDRCGTADGTVRKRRCPHGWCQPYAICKGCWNTPTVREDLRRHHVTTQCEQSSKDFNTREQRKAMLLAEGHWIRTAAVNDGPGRVKVWFRNEKGDEAIRHMTPEQYSSRPTLEPSTMQDFGLEEA